MKVALVIFAIIWSITIDAQNKYPILKEKGHSDYNVRTGANNSYNMHMESRSYFFRSYLNFMFEFDEVMKQLSLKSRNIKLIVFQC
jgi:hypothetical protein